MSSTLGVALAITTLTPQAQRLAGPQPVEPPQSDTSPPTAPGAIDQDRLKLIETFRPEYERLRAEIDAENARDGDWTDEITAAIGQPFDDACRKIIDMPPAVTRVGRALKAVVAMHEIVYDGGHFADSSISQQLCWNMLKQEVGEEFRLPGARP